MLVCVNPLMTEWSRRLEQKRREKGWSKAELQRRSGLSYDDVSKYSKGAVKQPRYDKMETLAEALGVSLRWLRDGIGPETTSIPVLGYTSGGNDMWTPVDDHFKGDGIDTVEFQIDFDDPIAVTVKGTSMTPVYRAGDTLICSRHLGSASAQYLHHDCVIKTKDGECYIKTVLPGTNENLVRLRSYNPDYDDIEDVELEWAAPVVWVHKSR